MPPCRRPCLRRLQAMVGLTSSALVIAMVLSLIPLDPHRAAMPQQVGCKGAARCHAAPCDAGASRPTLRTGLGGVQVRRSAGATSPHKASMLLPCSRRRGTTWRARASSKPWASLR